MSEFFIHDKIALLFFNIIFCDPNEMCCLKNWKQCPIRAPPVKRYPVFFPLITCSDSSFTKKISRVQEMGMNSRPFPVPHKIPVPSLILPNSRLWANLLGYVLPCQPLIPDSNWYKVTHYISKRVTLYRNDKLKWMRQNHVTYAMYYHFTST